MVKNYNFHSIISHCATLGVDPETRWGSHVFMTTIKPSGSAVRISQKWLWTFNIACTQKYAKCLHPFHSIISHCATLGVDPETRWGSHVFMTTIKPSGSAVRISQKWLWTFNIACTQKYAKCLHPFHSIISHCATLGVDPETRWGSHVFMTTIKPSGSAVRISQKWLWTFNIACTQKYAKCLHPFHSIISHCATLGVDPETRWGSHVFMTTIKPSGSAVRISQKWLWTFNIACTQPIFHNKPLCHPQKHVCIYDNHQTIWICRQDQSKISELLKCLHPFHSIISHCATLGVDPETRWGSHVFMTTIKPSGSAVRISQKWLWTFNIACTQKYAKCLHPFHSIISHCATLGVDPETRWGSHVFMTTIKPSGSAVRISQKWLWTFNISHTQKYAKCLHPFHSIISHCATLGVGSRNKMGVTCTLRSMTTIKPSGSAVRISQKWLWTFNISCTQKYAKCLHPFHSIISHCATLGVDPETRWGSHVFMTTIKPSGSAVRISQKWLWTFNISHTQK